MRPTARRMVTFSIGLLALASACGGRTLGTNPGTIAANCPTSIPTTGDACNPSLTTECHFGEASCSTAALCVGEGAQASWVIIAPPNDCAPNSPACPAAFGDQASCSIGSSLVCAYSQGLCGCVVSGSTCTPQWTCAGVSEVGTVQGGACPTTMPEAGTSCAPQGFGCDYSGNPCASPSLGTGVVMTCQGGLWTASTPLVGCPSSASCDPGPLPPVADAAAPYPVGMNPYDPDAATPDASVDAGSDASVDAGPPDAASPLCFTASNFASGPASYAVAIADFSGDGFPDLAVANFAGYATGGSVVVLLNEGKGTFASPITVSQGTDPASLVAIDIDGNGLPDLAVTYGSGSLDSSAAGTVDILVNQGNGLFMPGPVASTLGAAPLAAADMNGDGIADVAVADGTQVNVFATNGVSLKPAFANTYVAQQMSAIAAGDMNGDGAADLVVVDYLAEAVTVLLNESGTLVPLPSSAVNFNPSSITLADFDGNGTLDVAVAAIDFPSTVSVLFNGGGGVLAGRTDYATGNSPWGVASADFNGDGKADLVTANAGDDNAGFFLNSGSGEFAAAASYPVATTPASVSVGDLNGDGKPDVVTSSAGSDFVTVLLACP